VRVKRSENIDVALIDRDLTVGRR